MVEFFEHDVFVVDISVIILYHNFALCFAPVLTNIYNIFFFVSVSILHLTDNRVVGVADCLDGDIWIRFCNCRIVTEIDLMLTLTLLIAAGSQRQVQDKTFFLGMLRFS